MKGLLTDFGGVLTTNVFDSFKAFCELEGLPAGIHRFRNMPLPDEVARLGNELLKIGTTEKQS